MYGAGTDHLSALAPARRTARGRDAEPDPGIVGRAGSRLGVLHLVVLSGVPERLAGPAGPDDVGRLAQPMPGFGDGAPRAAHDRDRVVESAGAQAELKAARRIAARSGLAGVAARGRGRTIAIAAGWCLIEVQHGDVCAAGQQTSMTGPSSRRR
jgi:hypothetical protein